jgi:hypothetical protein
MRAHLPPPQAKGLGQLALLGLSIVSLLFVVCISYHFGYS